MKSVYLRLVLAGQRKSRYDVAVDLWSVSDGIYQRSDCGEGILHAPTTAGNEHAV